jgi:hypothetical protein
MVFGGTSASSPLIAATYALGGAPSADSYPVLPLGAYLGAIRCHQRLQRQPRRSYLWTGTSGYYCPSGIGVPNGTAVFTG